MNLDEKLPDKRPVTLTAAFFMFTGWGEVEWAYDESGIERVFSIRTTKLRHWREDFYLFRGTVYEKYLEEELRADVIPFLNSQKIQSAAGKVTFLSVVNSDINNVIAQLRAICQARVPAMPAFLDPKDTRDPKHIIAFRSGLLDVAQYLELADTEPTPHTPNWFSEVVLPCDFDPAAKCPKWTKFLDESLDGDVGLINILQEWFGYCLTGDTRHHKMLWPHGPPRTGKSTTINVLRHVVGEANCAAFNLWDLAKNFTLSTWIGKRLVCSADAELGRSTEAQQVLARLKGIIGGDAQFVDRKNRDALAAAMLTVRLVISTNEFPPLPDASDAMLTRAMFIPFDRAVGKESQRKGLFQELTEETDGIAAWALSGLQRLDRQQDFSESNRSHEISNEFRRIQNPVHAFVEDCCRIVTYIEVGQRRSGFVSSTDLYSAFKKWAEQNGRQAFSKEGFGMRLRRVCPTIVRARTPSKDDENRSWEMRGIQLLQEWVPAVADYSAAYQ